MTETTEHLTFDEVTARNITRCARWHDPESEPWSSADWSNAMLGEVGELADALDAFVLMGRVTAAAGIAANTVKKLRRDETRAKNAGDPSPAELRRALEDEAADVFCYLDLLCSFLGIDLPTAIARKFNRVSERQGFPERLPERAEVTDG